MLIIRHQESRILIQQAKMSKVIYNSCSYSELA
jgi:hypothetical protein